MALQRAPGCNFEAAYGFVAVQAASGQHGLLCRGYQQARREQDESGLFHHGSPSVAYILAMEP
jgi:hypothetical protein